MAVFPKCLQVDVLEFLKTKKQELAELLNSMLYLVVGPMMGACDAIAHLNIGNLATVRVLK